MPVPIRRHLDRGVSEAALHHLDRQFEAAIGPGSKLGGLKINK
jgi:hypothetical protein